MSHLGPTGANHTSEVSNSSLPIWNKWTIKKSLQGGRQGSTEVSTTDSKEQHTRYVEIPLAHSYNQIMNL